jgi:hypothetical protein
MGKKYTVTNKHPEEIRASYLAQYFCRAFFHQGRIQDLEKGTPGA